MKINDSYFTNFPIIESDRLLLRKLSFSDAEKIHEIRTNPQVMKFMDSEPHQSMHDSELFIQKGYKSYANKHGLFWAITLKKTNDFIGDIAFWRIMRENLRAEIGYTMLPQFWGNGYMSEALKEVLSFGFHQLQLHSLEAEINPNNEHSRNLLVKMGFHKEAHLKENRFFKGEFIDSEIYSLLKKDFNTI